MAAEAGDVVIRRTEGRACTVEIHPNRPQVTARDYPSALRLAQRFCRATHARRLWFVDRDGTLQAVKVSDPET